MPDFPQSLRCLAIAAALTAPAPAAALDDQARVVAHYVTTIAGIEIGTANLMVEREGAGYSAALEGLFAFMIWRGAFEAETTGAHGGARFSPRSYDSVFESPRRSVTISAAFDERGATGADWRSEPPFDRDEDEERVPVQPADLVGARDPLSSLLIPAASGAEACDRSLKIFNGIVRFDIDLAPAAPEGSVVTCAAAYRPVAGHRVDSSQVDLLRDGGLSVSVFEIAPGLWAPHRVGVQTMFGALALTRRPPG